MNEIMYLKEVNNKIVCTNYFGKNLEKMRKFIIKSFRVNQKVVSMAINNRKTYILLNSDVVLVFKDINMLKNEMFKDLVSEFKLAYFKYHIKRIMNSANFHLHRLLDKREVISASTISSILLVGTVALSNNNVNDSKMFPVNENTMSYKKLDEVSLTLDLNDKTRESEVSIVTGTTFNLDNVSDNAINYNDEELILYKDALTTPEQIANNFDFYKGEVYDNLVMVMDDYDKTAHLNNKIQEYISSNLKGKMWGNAFGQGYNNYKIPEKYKNGEFTLDELFTDASLEFGVPKDILVSISQHECGQGYYLPNNPKNCGGMMGYLNVHKLDSSYLPSGGYDGCDISTNPAISIYTYAATIRFFYDSFKDIDVGYGFDSWDISMAMVAIGQGDVSNNDVGFKYRADYEKIGWSQLNICAPQFKVLREAYLNGTLGVNDLTLTAENGLITHWTDGEQFYYIDGKLTVDRVKEQNKVLTKK